MVISLNELSGTYSWKDYYQLHEKLVQEGKTTGPVQNESMTQYTLLNLQRSKRIYNTLEFSIEQRKKIESLTTQNWLIISEVWCGDAAQSLPVLAKMASLNDKINLRIILRDEHLELIDLFLTNGARAIPKLIVLDKNDGVVVNLWGPRPQKAQQLFYKLRDAGIPKNEASLELQKWYNQNKAQDIIEEILNVALV